MGIEYYAVSTSCKTCLWTFEAVYQLSGHLQLPIRRLAASLYAHRIVRYFCVGLVALSLDVALFWLLVTAGGVHYLWAGALGFVLATLLNFELGLRFVFDPINDSFRRTAMLLVYAASSVGLVLHQAILYAGVEFAGLHPFAAKPVAIVIVFFWNYFSRSRLIFTSTRSRVH
jgi:putative flippase GtrA